MVDKLEATVGEQCASILEAAIATGYSTPVSKHDQCEHGKFGWEDCIACYDEQLVKVAEQMRAISTPTQDTRNRVKVLEEALRWALPLAERAMEDHRLERIRCGHSDITGTYKNGVTWVGIHQSEVEQIERARTALGNKETDRHG